MEADEALQGDPLLAAVTEAMVAMHERYHGRAPVAAKSLMMGDDLLACVLGSVYTEVEKTMIECIRPSCSRLAAPFRTRCNTSSSTRSRR
jgi:hypothetical protein